MDVTFRGQTCVPTPAIRPNDASGFKALNDSNCQAFVRGILYPAESNASNPIIFVFSRDDHQCLSCRATTSLARLRAADICFIDFNSSRQPVPSRTYHGTSQLMQPYPGRFIASKTKHPFQTHGAYTVFLADNIPHGPKPKSQRFSGVLKNSACSDRGLKVAMAAPI